MLDGRGISLRAQAPNPIPIEAMVLGQKVEDAAALLPRVFNLCRAAQDRAARHALGLTVDTDDTELRSEIIRDHVLRLTMILPRHFGQTSHTLPQDWRSNTTALRQSVFGAAGILPRNPDEFVHYIEGDQGLAPLLSRLCNLFRPQEASTTALSFVCAKTALDPNAAVENSPAQRVKDHPVVEWLAQSLGRGPFWRVVARAYDLELILNGATLTLDALDGGGVSIPATRGTYSVTARTKEGRVSSFSRVTPTDHLRAKDGVLDQTLARLDVARSNLAPLVMDILDPCSPITLKEVQDA